MTTPELRVFFNEWSCGCGSPESVVALVYDVLSAINKRWKSSESLSLFKREDRPALEDTWKQAEADMKAVLPTDGLYYFVLYLLTHWDLLEHGSSVGGSWLTDKGRDVLSALEREHVDGFESVCKSCCIHGFDVEDQDHDCMATP